MVWISNELRSQLEDFVRVDLGVKVRNVGSLVNIAEIVRKAIAFALNDRRQEFKDYVAKGEERGRTK